MKWCMVAAVVGSLLFSGMAWAQDDWDLDALLEEDSGSDGTAAVADNEATADVTELVDGFADAPAEAEPVVEEVATEVAEFSDDVADAPAEAEPVAVEAIAAIEEDPFADPFAGVAEPETPAGDEQLDDLFADAAPAEEPAPVADDFTDEDFATVPEEAVPFDASAMQDDFADDAAFTDASAAPAPAPKAAEDEKLSAKELKRLAKEAAAQEEVRRQADEADALKSSETAFRQLSDGDYINAEAAFASALAKLPDRPQNVDVRKQIAWGQAEAQYLRARAMVQKKERLGEARKLVDSALKVAPDHRGAQALSKSLSKLEAIEALPKPPAKQPATIERAQNIDQMYDEAREWYKLKDYDRSSALFERILDVDPYHKSAMRYLRKIEADKYKLATYEREARVQGMLTDVRRTWSPPIRTEIEVPSDLKTEGSATRPDSERLNEKMQSIIIPAVEFRQANINDVVNFLVEASIAADPEKEGVNIILNLGGSGAPTAPVAEPVATAADDMWGDFGGDDFGAAAAPASVGSSGGVSPITLNLRRISMINAIKYITEVASLKYRIEDSAVIITRSDAPVGNIITRMYPVQPSFMDVVVERSGSTSEERDEEFVSLGGKVNMQKSDVKEFFEKTGVKFPAGASITYNATISQLIVANTADNLETFERILQQLNVVPNQVEIEARFIEVEQSDLEELGLQWILNDNWEIATKNDGSGGRVQMNANKSGVTQGNRFFNIDSNTGNISPASAISRIATQTPLGSVASFASVLTNPEVSVVIQALSQHGGSDLLSAPRVTTRSGVNAQIQVVKEIIYPTEFDSEIITIDQETETGASWQQLAAVSTPGSFETRETGVILNVTPTVGPDGYTIDLVMAPEVCELVDWIQYGGAVGDYFFNQPMPIFTSRNVTTSLVIWDGQTVVMGGLIREELTTIKDKVPILGDIPVLGWLFRSEGQYSVKKNLLIFVTARLVDPAGRPVHREGNVLPGSGIEATGEEAAM